MFIIGIKFIICTAIIFFAGKRAARYGDIIAEKTGLGGLWIGLVLIAVMTSLPEVFTGVGCIVFVDAPNLSVGNLFGANTYNLLNLGLLDFLHKGSPLLSAVSQGQLLTAGLSIIPLLITTLGIFLSLRWISFSLLNISIYSLLILLSYLVCVRIIFKFEKEKNILKELQEETEKVFKYKETSLFKVYLFYGFSAVVIVTGGIWLSYIGKDLVEILGIGENFIGTLFLGFTTTLPEITVSAAALRLGAKEMAVANMLGSNLFNMSIIFLNDALYRKTAIFHVLSENHIFTAFMVIFMTCVVISGLSLRPKNKVYALLLIATFLIGSYFNFFLETR